MPPIATLITNSTTKNSTITNAVFIEGLLFGYEYQAIFGVAENVKTIFWR